MSPLTKSFIVKTNCIIYSILGFAMVFREANDGWRWWCCTRVLGWGGFTCTRLSSKGMSKFQTHCEDNPSQIKRSSLYEWWECGSMHWVNHGKYIHSSRIITIWLNNQSISILLSLQSVVILISTWLSGVITTKCFLQMMPKEQLSAKYSTPIIYIHIWCLCETFLQGCIKLRNSI